MQTNRWGVWVIVGVAGLAASAGAFAQDDGGLGGPKVKDASVQGERRTLTGKGDPKIERAGRMQPRLFERALGVLRADDAQAELKLSEDQETKIHDIREEFLGQLRSYIDEHKDEAMRLREQLPPRERWRVDQFMNAGQGQGGPAGERAKGPRGKGRGGDNPTPPPPPAPHEPDAMQGDEPMAGEVEAAKARLKELMDGAPKPVDAHSRVMAVLNDAQRDAVNKELERLQKEAGERGRAGGRDGAREEVREELMKRLTPEEKEKLKTMTPEERRAFLRDKVQERAKKGK